MSGQDRRDSLDAESASEDLTELLQTMVRLVRRGIMLDLRVSAPARVTAFNTAQNTVDVTLEQLPVAYQGQVEVAQEPISIPDVPISYPRGSLGGLEFPMAPSDTGYVVFADRCISPWLQKGVPGDPESGRTHDVADAYFEPGITPFTQVTPIDTTATVVDGAAAVKIGAAANLATGRLAFAQGVHEYLVAMFAAAPTGAMDGGAAFKAGLAVYLGANPFATFATTKAVAE